MKWATTLTRLSASLIFGIFLKSLKESEKFHFPLSLDVYVCGIGKFFDVSTAKCFQDSDIDFCLSDV